MLGQVSIGQIWTLSAKVRLGQSILGNILIEGCRNQGHRVKKLENKMILTKLRGMENKDTSGFFTQ